MIEPLTPVQLRVLGSLVEKAATVPDTYPMTLNGLRTACNQKTSREPVMDLAEHEIRGALDELKAAGFVRFVHASHGARATKFRHVADERFGVDDGELALLAVLALRGPQTVNELRTRTERAHDFADNDAVTATLQDLAARDEPLVRLLPHRPGQREARWTHLLGGADPDLDPGHATPADVAAMAAPAPTAPVTRDGPTPGPTPGPTSGPTPGAGSDVAALQDRVAELEARVAAIEALLTDPTPAPTLATAHDPTPEEPLP